MDVDQIEDIYAPTPPQGMLFKASLMSPGIYILRMTFQLPTSVQLEAFIAAWDWVIQSADILRTRFVLDSQADLVQVVVKDFQWDSFDSVQEYEAQNDYTSMGYGSRLARCGIIHDNASETTPIFVFAAHHALYEGFMLNLIFDRVAERYQRVSIRISLRDISRAAH